MSRIGLLSNFIRQHTHSDSGDGGVFLAPRRLQLHADITASPGANENDYSPAGWQDTHPTKPIIGPLATTIFLQPAAASIITGLRAYRDDVIILSPTFNRPWVAILINMTAQLITLKHSDGLSVAKNRFFLPLAQDYVLSQNESVILEWSRPPSNLGWRVIGGSHHAQDHATRHEVGGADQFDTLIAPVNFEAYGDGTFVPYLRVRKSRNATPGAHTIVQNGDRLGGLIGAGSDGSTFRNAGYAIFEVDGVPGAADMPGRFVVYTTPDGSVNPIERMRIDSAGATIPTALKPLSLYLPTQAGAAGTLKFTSGPSFPASPSQGDLHYHTNASITYVYIASFGRWFSTHRESITMQSAAAVGTNAAHNDYGPFPTSDVYIEEINMFVWIGTPNNASNYWLWRFDTANASFVRVTSLTGGGTTGTEGLAAGTSYQLMVYPAQVCNLAGGHKFIWGAWSIGAGAPGGIYHPTTITYRRLG